MVARKKAQIERDRKNIADMYLAGKTQMEIAEEVGLNQATVSRDLKVIRGIWMKETTMNIDAQKAAQLARLDKYEASLWKAWLASTKQKKVSKAGMTVLIPQDSRNPQGNPSYITAMLRCGDQRRSILGLDAPIRHDHGVELKDINVTLGKK